MGLRLEEEEEEEKVEMNKGLSVPSQRERMFLLILH